MNQIRERGQFIPIAAMVMLTTVVSLTAVVDIYQVTRAKLTIQNLADAAALNVATQMAGSMNKVADLNEWMNHMLAQPANVPASTPGTVPNCQGAFQDLPPISCAENATKSSSLNMFSLKGNAANYAGLIQKINQSQQLFIDAYNNFIGAGTGSNSSISSNSSLRSILFADIPDLGNPGTSVVVWNDKPPASASAPPAANQSTTLQPAAPPVALDTSGMRPLKFKIHDITVTYKTVVPILNTPGPTVAMTLGQLLATSNQPITPVGWMEPDTTPGTGSPEMQVGSGKMRLGAGARVSRTVTVPVFGSVHLTAQAQAYIVQDSGTMGITVDPLHPVFKPTYWVKLVGT